MPAATLTRLVCCLEFGLPQHLAALCGLTALRSLHVLDLECDGAELKGLLHCCSSVLRPMSALQQLTALKLDAVLPQQLAHMHPPQLRRREVIICRDPGDDLEEQQQQQLREAVQAPTQQMQLGHLTSLTYLECSGSTLLPSDELPTSLLAVKLSYDCEEHSCRGAACSMQPLLKLSLLEQLEMAFEDQLPAVEELRRLASLQHLRELSCTDICAGAKLAAAIDQAWGVLPLTCLEVTGSTCGGVTPCTVMSAAALHALSVMTLLESFTLSINKHLGQQGKAFILFEATFAQLAPVLTADLATAEQAGEWVQQQEQQVETSGDGEHATALLQPQPASYHSVDGVLALCSTVGRLPCLDVLQLWLPVRLQPMVLPQLQQQLSQASQPSHLDRMECASAAGSGTDYVVLASPGI